MKVTAEGGPPPTYVSPSQSRASRPGRARDSRDGEARPSVVGCTAHQAVHVLLDPPRGGVQRRWWRQSGGGRPRTVRPPLIPRDPARDGTRRPLSGWRSVPSIVAVGVAGWGRGTGLLDAADSWVRCQAESPHAALPFPSRPPAELSMPVAHPRGWCVHDSAGRHGRGGSGVAGERIPPPPWRTGGGARRPSKGSVAPSRLDRRSDASGGS